MNSVKDQWDRYAAAVIPSSAPPIQLIESRRAFYAGAWALFTLMTGPVSEHDNDAVGVAMIEFIRQEMIAFRDAVEKGQA